MSLADEYDRQFGWRDWPAVFAALPALDRQVVLDLGCGTGAVAAALVARGARVIGFDADETLLERARARRLPGAGFLRCDLRALPDPGCQADGLWCSFTAAYFPEFAQVLNGWSPLLRPVAWLAITDVDDLFGHAPLAPRTDALLRAYADESLAAGRYDFRMGSKLVGHLERAGLQVATTIPLGDRELSFAGPGTPAVLAAWGARFDRMRLLRDFCGAEFERVREDFLACLAHPDHRCTASVVCCLAST